MYRIYPDLRERQCYQSQPHLGRQHPLQLLLTEKYSSSANQHWLTVKSAYPKQTPRKRKKKEREMKICATIQWLSTRWPIYNQLQIPRWSPAAAGTPGENGLTSTMDGRRVSPRYWVLDNSCDGVFKVKCVFFCFFLTTHHFEWRQNVQLAFSASLPSPLFLPILP